MTRIRGVVAATQRFQSHRRAGGARSMSNWSLKREWNGDVLFGVAPVFAALEAKRQDLCPLFAKRLATGWASPFAQERDLQTLHSRRDRPVSA